MRAHGRRVLNETPLPLVCFVPARGNDDAADRIAAGVIASGHAWISTVRVRGHTALRACITNYETTRDDVDALVTLLDEIRAAEEA